MMPRAFGLVLSVAFVFGATAADNIVEDYAIAAALTDQSGDPTRGQAVMRDRELGNCLSCHAAPVEAEFFGTTGPDLAGVGTRLTPAQLRLRLIDSKRINPMSMMPSYYKHEGLHRVLDEFDGTPLVSHKQK